MLESNVERPNPNVGVPVVERLKRQVVSKLEREAAETTYVVDNPEVFLLVEGSIGVATLKEEEREEGIEPTDTNEVESTLHEGYEPLSDNVDFIRYDPYSGELAMRFERRNDADEPITAPDDIVLYNPPGTPKQRKHVFYDLYPSVERAKRQIEHIVAQHHPKTGKTMIRMWELQAVTYKLNQQVKSGEITKENFDEASRQVEEALRRMGMDRARLKALLDLEGQVRLSVTRDSQGRYNPMVSQTHLGSAKGREKVEIGRLYGVRRGFVNRRNILEKERENERVRLERMRQEVIASSDQASPIKAQVNLEYRMRRMTLNDIKVAPYRPAAAKARMVFFGTEGINEAEMPMYKSLVGDDFFEMAQAQFAESFARLVQVYGSDPDGISRVLRERGALIETIMQDSLDRGEQNMVPWTDSDYSDEEKVKKWKKYHPDKTS